jgi:hypothetical protein
MLVKRTAQTGQVPTVPPVTAVTLNQMIPTDLFIGEFYLNEIMNNNSPDICKNISDIIES